MIAEIIVVYGERANKIYDSRPTRIPRLLFKGNVMLPPGYTMFNQ